MYIYIYIYIHVYVYAYIYPWNSLPSCMAKLQKLRVLFFLGNTFETIPSILRELGALETLSFKGNRLTHLGFSFLSCRLRAVCCTVFQCVAICCSALLQHTHYYRVF